MLQLRKVDLSYVSLEWLEIRPPCVYNPLPNLENNLTEIEGNSLALRHWRRSLTHANEVLLLALALYNEIPVWLALSRILYFDPKTAAWQ